MISPTILALAAGTEIPPVLIIPFGLLLLLIATMPLTPSRVKHLWEHYYPHVAFTLGALVTAFYALRMPGGGPVIGHTLHEYFSFISLIGSLVILGEQRSTLTTILGAIAVTASTINVVSGFLITDRMLKMFKKRPEAEVRR